MTKRFSHCGICWNTTDSCCEKTLSNCFIIKCLHWGFCPLNCVSQFETQKLKKYWYIEYYSRFRPVMFYNMNLLNSFWFSWLRSLWYLIFQQFLNFFIHIVRDKSLSEDAYFVIIDKLAVQKFLLDTNNIYRVSKRLMNSDLQATKANKS